MTCYVKATHPDVLAKWKAEIDALPARKKGKWSALAKNQQGEFRRYRYHKGYFELKLNSAAKKEFGLTEWPTDGWAPVIPLRGRPTYEQLERSYGAVHATTYIENLHETVAHGRIEGMTDEEAVTAEGLIVQQLIMIQSIGETHTGHHHRNTPISVPTAAGQPVRG